MPTATRLSRRWLAVAAVVFGLFLMHGVTADHEMPMPMANAAKSHLGAGHMQETDGDAFGAAVTDPNVTMPGHAGAMTSSVSARHPLAATAAAGMGPVTDLVPSTAAPLPVHTHGAAGTCLALLGAVVLMPLALMRLSRRRLRELLLTARRIPLVRVPWRTPLALLPASGLTQLCISRT